MATPRLAGGTPRIGLPPIATMPPLIGSSPQIMRSNVDLPQPDGPTKTTNSPCSIVRSMSRIMTVLAIALADGGELNLGHGSPS